MTVGSGTTAFFSKTFDETVDLLDRTKSFVAVSRLGQGVAAAETDRLLTSIEAFRVTTRLAQVMVWLLAQKAVHAGELTLEDVIANPEFELGAEDVCLDDRAHEDPRLPRELRILLDLSHRLYLRVTRLDTMMRSRPPLKIVR